MARSSGGGSRSGGSRSGGSSSSSSRSSSSRSRSGNGRTISDSPFPNSRKFRYYRNGSPCYVYSNVDLTQVPDAKPRWFLILFYLPFIAAVISMFASAFTIPQRPLSLSTSSVVSVIDNADVFESSEETELLNVLNEFSQTTGITTQIVTVDWEEWERQFSYFPDYAYYRYYAQFDDENCWLLVYSEKDRTQFVDFEWEGIQGDNTIDTMDVFIDSFNTDVHSLLMIGAAPDTAAAFTTAFNNAIDEFENQKIEFDFEMLLPALAVAAFVIFHASIMIFAGTRKKYSNKELEEVREEVFSTSNSDVCDGSSADKTCPFCGKLYTINLNNRCPHCNSYLNY